MAALHASALSAAARARETNGTVRRFLSRADAGPGRDRIGATGARAARRCGTVRGRDDSRARGATAGLGLAARQAARSVAASPVGGAGPATSGASGGDAAVSFAGDPADACAAERRVAAERCGLAVGARVRATEAADLLRAAQRTYDDHITAADAAAAVADARAVRREKEAAQSRVPRGLQRLPVNRGSRGSGPGLARRHQRGQHGRPDGGRHRETGEDGGDDHRRAARTPDPRV